MEKPCHHSSLSTVLSSPHQCILVQQLDFYLYFSVSPIQHLLQQLLKQVDKKEILTRTQTT